MRVEGERWGEEKRGEEKRRKEKKRKEKRREKYAKIIEETENKDKNKVKKTNKI